MLGLLLLQDLLKDRQIRFFRSFAAYNIPQRPQGEIEFEQTKDLASYCAAKFDSDGRLALFCKIIVQRLGHGFQQLASPHEPGSILFFAGVLGAGQSPAIDQPTDYAGTKEQDVYYRGCVDADGLLVRWERLSRKEQFSEQYSYWPNGKLKERVVRREDGRVSQRSCDTAGRPVPTPEDQGTHGRTPAY